MSIRLGNKIIAGTGGGGTNVLVDNETIIKNNEDIITTVGVQSKTGDVLYDWIGTLYEYETAVAAGTIQENWVCYITDDQHHEEIDMLHQVDLNNPFFFGMYQYFEFEPNNLSWLRSAGQWNSRDIYVSYYMWLEEQYNEGNENVKLIAEEYDDYNFVINQEEGTFRLPTKVKLASGKAVVGNGMALGLTDGIENYGAIVVSGRGISGSTSSYGSAIGQTPSAENIGVKTQGITTDPTKSGIETSTEGLHLYFYVGETVQNANLINAGRIEEKLADCITRNDCSAYIVETYVNDTSWYRVYSDGWCEQGGVKASISNDYLADVVYLIKEYKDTNYVVLKTKNRIYSVSNTTADNFNTDPVMSKTTTSFTIWNNTSLLINTAWYTCGYIR